MSTFVTLKNSTLLRFHSSAKTYFPPRAQITRNVIYFIYTKLRPALPSQADLACRASVMREKSSIDCQGEREADF